MITHSVADAQWSELQRLHAEMTERFDEHTIVEIVLGLPSDHPDDQKRTPSGINVWIGNPRTECGPDDFHDFGELIETFDLSGSSKPTRDRAVKTLRDLADAIERAPLDAISLNTETESITSPKAAPSSSSSSSS